MEGILLIPNWPRISQLLKLPYNKAAIPSTGKQVNPAGMLSRNPFKAKEFCNALSVSSCHLGVIWQRNSKEHTCKSGKGSVVEGLLIYCNFTKCKSSSWIPYWTLWQQLWLQCLKDREEFFFSYQLIFKFSNYRKSQTNKAWKTSLKVDIQSLCTRLQAACLHIHNEIFGCNKIIDFCTLLHEHSALKSHVIFKWLMVRYN